MEVKEGGCGCGALRYSVEGEPINSIFCYCKECQVLTNSDKWFGAWFPKEKFKILSGNPGTHSRKGDSGKDLIHMFCPTCGVTIGAEVTAGNFISVAVPSLDYGCNIKPAMSIYASSAPEWALFPEGVPTFDVLPPNLGG